MSEINLNTQLADLLTHHGVDVKISGDLVTTNLPGDVKFGAWSTYQQFENAVNSRLDVLIITGEGYKILESFGDIGETIEDAIQKNLQNFSTGSFHVLLTALGSHDPHSHDQVTIEEWEINGFTWQAYIGNLTPKISADAPPGTMPPRDFFETFVRGINAQQLSNDLHWFRAYYLQANNEITGREFLMDNVEMSDSEIFNNLPVIPNVQYYSCRNFIILKKKIIL